MSTAASGRDRATAFAPASAANVAIGFDILGFSVDVLGDKVSVKRTSKPGCRIYASVGEIPRVLGGLGVCILSTSRGLMTGDQAKQANVGGELLCEVW